MGKKRKKRRVKESKFKQRKFVKNYGEFVQEMEEKKKRMEHKRVYGVYSFEEKEVVIVKK